jgi:hypothetical protein
VLFQGIVAGRGTPGHYPFRATLLVHDMDAGYPPNRYYGRTCVGKLEQEIYTLSLDDFGGWDAQGRMTGFDPVAVEICSGGTNPSTAEQLLARVQDGLADEIHRMLGESVVVSAEDIDLCMILGAGWPFQMGGATPYLDRVGASERVFGSTFHTPPIKGV